MGKTVEAIRGINVEKAVALSLIMAVLYGGIRLGINENKVDNVCASIRMQEDSIKRHDEILSEVRAEAAYQKGVTNTMLTSISERTTAIESDVKKLLENLELDRE